jgi:transposase-like protein
VTKAKCIFPSDESLLKILYLATMDFTRKWTGRIVNWGQILAQLSIYFEERLNGTPTAWFPQCGFHWI